MSNIPPPPPPLSPLNIFRNTVNGIVRNNNSCKINIEFKECVWASADNEVQKACYFARICTHSAPVECVYSRINPILQQGPTCGLTSLSMVFCGRPVAADLLAEAIDLRFSNNGEMFSAQWLLQLLKDNLNISNVKATKPENVRAYIYDGIINSEFIKEKLKKHCMLLVPYDADIRDHSPTNLNGHKAHWALICGYLIEESEDFHVFARHGKTKNLGLFSLKDLSDSNNNLNEFAQPVQHVGSIFMLPDGGINGNKGLKNKSIVIEGLLNEVVKVV